MMQDVRCDGFYIDKRGLRHKCTRLLCRVEPGSRVEIKCPSCNKLVTWPRDGAENTKERQERR